MRKFALLAAVASVAAFGSAAHADFIYKTVVTQSDVTVGSLTNVDVIQLQIEGVAGTVQSTNIAAASVTESSTASSPQFYIRTWNKSEGAYDDQGGGNPNADFANQGALVFTTGGAARGTNLSYANFGSASNFVFASSTPDESATTYTDFQSVPGFNVQWGNNGPAAVSTTAYKILAEAVVPTGQEVTFSGNVISDLPADTQGIAFSLSANTPTPEPTSFAVIGIGAAGLLTRRRRA